MEILIPSLIVFLDLVLPAALLWWLWKSRAQSRVYLFSVLVVAALYLAAITFSIAGFWYVVGSFWPFLFLIAFLTIVATRFRRGLPTRWVPTLFSKEFFLAGLNALQVFVLALLLVRVVDARAVEVHGLKLSPPLRNGTFLIIGGGANAAVNQHTRAVKYALDISQLNAFGFRARSAAMYPRDLSKYEIFRAEVVAPCAGEIIGVESRAPNQAPLHPDDSGFGNYIALYCQGHTVRLVHLDGGSVKIAVGESVKTGQLLGHVGSSGNSFEPHLHIDAVAGRNVLDDRDDRGMQSVPIEIAGRFLIKGDSFTN